VIPYIAKEVEKVERETRKILGHFNGRLDPEPSIVPADIPVSCTCTRVPVLDGHTECVFVSLRRQATLEDVKRSLAGFAPFGERRFFSAPARMIEVLDDPYRPQPRLDRDAGGGMTTVVGRVREETTLGSWGVKYVLVSHNTRMGAAKGMVLLAETLREAGYIA
jgi:aspartate-semialdehyde dehydrogenase